MLHGALASEVLIANAKIERVSYEKLLAKTVGARFRLEGPEPSTIANQQEGAPDLGAQGCIVIEEGNRQLSAAPQICGYAHIMEMHAEKPGIFDKVEFSPAQALRGAIFTRHSDFYLSEAHGGMRRDLPHYSAAHRLTLAQSVFLIAIVVAGLTGLYWHPGALLGIAGGVLSLFYLAIILLRLIILAALDQLPASSRLSRAATHEFSPVEHPTYSILIALYKEAGQVPALVEAMERIDWPKDRLEVFFVCEADDAQTITALEASNLRAGFRIVPCPASLPRTKPKALNYALPLCRGEFVVVYDAEDRPHPGQLQEAWARFRSAPDRLACLQAPLLIHNHRQNWLTTIFSMEYHSQFLGMLPVLEMLGGPIALGGTSNHFRTSVLREIGAWDPYNVTEDADLGLRLARQGYRCGTLRSPTMEEAPPVFSVWLKQRTRWLKGWLQTVLVHTRNPVRLHRDLGWRGTMIFHLTITAIVVSMLIHPFFLLQTAFLIADMNSGEIHSTPSLALLGLCAFNLAGGYTSHLCMMAAVQNMTGWHKPVWYLATLPFYWLLISFAGWRAFIQLIFRPFHWEKTTHGLSNPPQRHNIRYKG
ncbi:MAG: glycosyltransferase [Rhizobiaceae bacterium]